MFFPHDKCNLAFEEEFINIWITSFQNYRLYATPYNGTLFISGGRGAGSGASADKAETLFLSLDGSFRYGPDLPTTRRDHCSVELHDGRLVI